MRIGIGVSEDLPLGVQADLAGRVEAAGAASLWTNEARGRDALLVCQAWGAATSSLDVAVGVVPIWTRTPAQLAMSAATLQDATGGRFVLGLGVSHPAMVGAWHGVSYRSPLLATRDYLAILRRLLGGEASEDEGAVFRSRGFRLAITPQPNPPPILLGAMGPRMLQLAAAHADGVLLNWATPDEAARAGGAVRATAAAGGAETHVAAYVRVAVDPDPAAARAALAREFGSYCALPAYADHFRRQGLGDAVAAAKAAHREERATDLDPEVLDELGWAASPDDDPSGFLARYEQAGVDELVLRVVVTGDEAVGSTRRVVDLVAAVTGVGAAGR